ncbi:MAG: hypothetical protein GY801_10540, partial [bacterium]|nr:hypothetical protein [bacterium]
YRLTNIDNPTHTDEAYTYDPVGNRLTATSVSGSIEHNQNNELRLYGDTSFDYDANGNMTGKTNAAEDCVYGYNVQNRLVHVEKDDLLVAEYGYDHFGRRLWKEVDDARTYFFYSDEGLVAEYDESGNELRSYGYRPDSTWTTNPLWLKENGEYYWYQNDHLGTPQKLVDSAGTVVWSATYSAFGEVSIDIELITNNLRFPGQYFDAETGLHYNWNRYYDPDTGRYTRVDPIGFAGGDENLYAYVWSNPFFMIDPEGKAGIGDFMLIPPGIYPGIQKRMQRPRCKLGEYATTGLAAGAPALLTKWETEKLTRTLARTNNLGGDEQKAFRHCYVNCRMTQEMGVVNATQAGNTHEWCGSNTKNLPPDESICQSLSDAHNNTVGRRIGARSHFKETTPSYAPYIPSIMRIPSANCKTECLKALQDGVLTRDFHSSTCEQGEGDPWEQFRPTWWAF